MLINCVAYENGKRIADPTVEQISDYVERPDTFVWVALRDATATLASVGATAGAADESVRHVYDA
ncbi:MAG TPA: magnesium transporter, partial [Rhodocyclaceae bacterium]|nr:magnesium transporter [Rhodocyclaceae bacterium]